MGSVRWSQGKNGIEIFLATPPVSSLGMTWNLDGPSVCLELPELEGVPAESVIDVGVAGVHRIRIGRSVEAGAEVFVDFDSIPSGEVRVHPVNGGIILSVPPSGGSAGDSSDEAEHSEARSSDTNARLEQRIAELERRLAKTEQRVARVTESDRTAAPVDSVTRTALASNREAAATVPASPLQTGQEPTSVTPTPATQDVILADARPEYPHLRFAGFSNLDYGASEGDRHGNGFRSGQFVLHLSSPLSERVQVFGELALTAHNDGFESSVERAILRISQSDALRFSFGRFHTPVSWWNTEFHHGLWLQTSIERPYMVNFGSRFLPIHAVGAFASGRLPTAPLNLEYEAGIGNGRARDIAEPAQAGDVNNHRSLVFRLAARPGDFSQLAVGGSFYSDRITEPGITDYREQIASAFFAWTRETPELVAEFFHVRHTREGGSEGFNSWAGYGQAAYRLPWLHEAFKPYVRYERTQVSADDPVFFGFPGLRATIVGLRYDFSFFAALKAEYQRRKPSGSDPFNAGMMQIAFTF